MTYAPANLRDYACQVQVREKAMIRFTLNGKSSSFDGDETMPLLWYLRDHAGLTGTKFGCGIAQCGACTVHVDGAAVRSCSFPVRAAEGKHITTIEGLAGETLHAVQQAWIAEDVPQCGYCQAGQIMAAVDLLKRHPAPSDDDINALTNLCRCGTYQRIRKAIRRAASATPGEKLT
jgi:isoquinoline 1-oxidoreductase alpha subunit